VVFGSHVDFPLDDRWCGQDRAVERVWGQHFQFLTAIQHNQHTLLGRKVDLVAGSDVRRVVISIAPVRPLSKQPSAPMISGSRLRTASVSRSSTIRPETAGDALQRIACFCLKYGLSASGLDALGGLFDERGDRPWLRHVDGVAALDLGDRGTRPLRHGTLGHRRDHFILGDN